MRVQTIAFALAFSAANSLAAQVAAQPEPSASPTQLDPKLQPGKAVYEQHCAACHGVTGEGNGPAAVWLYPKPRNFTSGLFKIQSTPPGSPPTDEDLFQTVTRGMPGSSMPSFTYLSEQHRRDASQPTPTLPASASITSSRPKRKAN
ncbi:MAG: hypothetical protein DME25_02130 [Verrucomicrobia bacterium]|nr:MAG: hypothetical protein DME25_02130 [Verrucomicrobiota bacterium]